MAVRVVVVDDHEIVRSGLRVMLQRDSRIELVGTAGSGEEALEVIAEMRPDIAVVDYRLPGISGVELCEQITAAHADVAVIVLTTFLEDTVIDGALAAGAKAFVYKDVSGDNLMRAIHAVAQGEPVMDPKIAGRVASWSARQYASGEARLSRREVDVLRMVARGLSNRAIGNAMGLSENTIRGYLRRVQAKLGTKTRAETSAVAGRRGLL